jgi:hypothetical protein
MRAEWLESRGIHVLWDLWLWMCPMEKASAHFSLAQSLNPHCSSMHHTQRRVTNFNPNFELKTSNLSIN